MTILEKERIMLAIADTFAYIASRDPHVLDFVRYFETTYSDVLELLTESRPERTIGFAPTKGATNVN